MPASPPETLRLFVALWPEPDVRQVLAGHQCQWQWPAGARPTPLDKLHLTLHFLGDVPRSAAHALSQALDVPSAALAFELPVAEVWRGGVAVLRAAQVPAALAELHARLAHVITGFGLPVERRPFAPHVTLARHATGAIPPSCGAGPAAAWRSRGHALVVSRAGRYEVVRAYEENHFPPGGGPTI